jgi:hypothetical protein
MTESQVAAPRRYKVQFNLPQSSVGALYAALTDQVEALAVTPSSEPQTAGVSFITLMQGLGTIIELVESVAQNLVVAPHREVVSEAVRPFQPKERFVIPPGTNITRLPTHKGRGGGRKKASGPQAESALAVLRVKAIAHRPDFEDEAERRNISKAGVPTTLTKLVEWGLVVRCGVGAYRLPTEAEKDELERQRAIGR